MPVRENHALQALYWELVLAELEVLRREMEAMRPAVDAYLLRNLKRGTD